MLTMPISLPSSTTRQMAEPPVGHQREDLPVAVAGRAGLDRARHAGLDAAVEKRRTLFGKAAHDVALGDDPDQRLVLVGHDERADHTLREHGHRGCDGCVGRRGSDLAAFRLEDRADVHARVPANSIFEP